MTDPVRVWVRSLGDGCRVRVESHDDAQWLIEHLTASDALVGLEYIDVKPTESGCEFRIPISRDRTLATLESAIAQIPEAQLMLEPESV